MREEEGPSPVVAWHDIVYYTWLLRDAVEKTVFVK